jgi:hypothetical protein
VVIRARSTCGVPTAIVLERFLKIPDLWYSSGLIVGSFEGFGRTKVVIVRNCALEAKTLISCCDWTIFNDFDWLFSGTHVDTKPESVFKRVSWKNTYYREIMEV